ncbi:polar amino acid transport system substrate-binding protein [Fictibacillus barbaricus]|uniref:Polar amino acid transport system substrate-binding protein n=2 Tax=Fictibacillus barbaricus TaxID=182136 RepID=A0ABU1TZM1_9BACL|nr:transporter substrate-binding domain-containing protein [Fictibacillus barbaricus]MDR7072659.1 polar amino acid transport system substrate-binding protein [Fictibacillus barbaricus]
MMKKNFLMIYFIIILAMLAGCGAVEDKGASNSGGDESGKTLIMATSADYPPYEFVDTAKGGEVQGFDVDVANHIAKKLGYKIEIKDMDFNGLIPAINSGKADFVLAGMTPNAERKKKVDFSDEYYAAQQLIVTKDKSIKSVEDLKGKTLGVQLASIQEKEADKLLKNQKFNVVKRNKVTELIQEMKSNRVDAAIIEDAVAYEFLKKNKELSSFALPNTDAAGSAVAFPKDSDLTNKFNKELKKMKEDGTMDKLVEKWFGVKK